MFNPDKGKRLVQGYHLKDVPGEQLHLIGPLLYLETQHALMVWTTGGRKARCLLKYFVSIQASFSAEASARQSKYLNIATYNCSPAQASWVRGHLTVQALTNTKNNCFIQEQFYSFEVKEKI